MLRTRRAAAAALGAMLTATPLLAATPVADPPPKPRRAVGTIVSVDAAARTVVVRPEGGGAGDTAFRVAADARVIRGRRAVRLEALDAGQRVRVTYVRGAGPPVATRISVVSSPAP